MGKLLRCCDTDPDEWRWKVHLRAFNLTISWAIKVDGILASLLTIVVVAASIRLYQLSYAPMRHVSRTSRSRLRSKLILLRLACLSSLTTVCFILGGWFRPVAKLHHMLEPLALYLGLCLTYFNHLRTRSSSTILLLFWPCYVVVLSIGIYSYTVQNSSATLFVPLKWPVVLLGSLSFILECVSPCDVPDSNPRVGANIFSIWTFTWVTPLLRKGSQGVVTENDLWALTPENESARVGNDLQRALGTRSGLWAALFTSYGGPYVGAAVLKLIHDSLAFVQPALLHKLLSHVSEHENAHSSTSLNGYDLAILMFVTSMAQAILIQQYHQICLQTGMRVRAGLVTAIYKKALVLSNGERGRTTGDIVNLMSLDTNRIQELCKNGIIAISGPYQIILAVLSLYGFLGWSALVGVAIMICSVPLHTLIARSLKNMQKQQMKNRDQRIRLISELLANIKSIKLYAWENTFIRRVLHVRHNLELKILRRIGIITTINVTLWGGIPSVVAICSLAAASNFSTRPLTADIIFPAISAIALLQNPLAMFSQVNSAILEAVTSMKRLSDFLCAPELRQDVVQRTGEQSLSIGEVLSVRNGDFNWADHGMGPTLEGINLTARKGELVGVLGRVGAGKSSLLSAIIGDMRKTKGEVVVTGTMAYASQNPWILSATIRDNILFSHAYEETFYDLVIDACGLKPDLAVLPHGDMTQVGEKGIMLSGGQRARVALARAVYARADLVLLDDVLAAVDPHVARHVFDNAIGPQGLLATKARILVTNNLAYLRHFDYLVYIRHGVILECGTYQQLASSPEGAVHQLIENHTTEGSPLIATSGAPISSQEGASRINALVTGGKGSDTLPMDNTRTVAIRRMSFRKAIIAPVLPTRKDMDSGLPEEHSPRGRGKGYIYLQYLGAASATNFCFFVLMTTLGRVVAISSTSMLRLWAQRNREHRENLGLGDPYLFQYGLLNLISIVLFAAASWLMFGLCSWRCSRYLHDSALESILRAPLSFFEKTPTGSILNLFSRDIYILDTVIGKEVRTSVRTGIVTASILLIIGVNFPPFIIAIIPLSWFYYRVTLYYLSTSRTLKRLGAASRAPIITWFSETLSGLSTIRAYGQQAIFTAENIRRMDRNQMCLLPSIALDRWLAIRLEFIGSIIILLTAVLAVSAAATNNLNIDVGLVGLVMSYVLKVTGSLSRLVQSVGSLEKNVVNIERILHYANELPCEVQHKSPDDKPPATWPSVGGIEFREYSMRYRPQLDPVLKEISLVIKPKEKIGIVGRTGAGKSSLLLALFRILDASSGKILIDGVDISTINLHDLRSRIAIVPQNPDLFEGTLRVNIDPQGVYQDADIWVALEQAHLKSYVESLPGGLDASVREGGSSLSAGQKQLLCVSRALLKKSRVLVLDEATSAVDLDTDRAIQDIIRGPLFNNVTILTIAHRLNTVLDSMRILVLDGGCVVEFDTPATLLADRSSRFYSMAMEAGIIKEDRQ